jgi:2-phosphoglycolate phosphatase
MSKLHPASEFEAVIFDFDGTLVDSYEAIAASVNHVRASYQMPPLSTAEVRRHVGRGPSYLLEHTVPGSDIEKDLERYRVHHPSVLRSGTRLLPEVAETLRKLKAAGFRLAICSNKLAEFTRQLLEILGLADLIETVVGPEDAGKPKPAPDMLLAVLDRLSLSREQVLYVGDMVIDIHTARGAGVTVWVIPTGSEELEALVSAQPDIVMHRFSELARRLIGNSH